MWYSRSFSHEFRILMNHSHTCCMYQQTFNCANLEKLMQLSEYLPLKHRDSFTGVHSTLLISFCTSCFSHFVAGQNISFICDSFPLTSLDSLPSAMGPFFTIWRGQCETLYLTNLNQRWPEVMLHSTSFLLYFLTSRKYSIWVAEF